MAIEGYKPLGTDTALSRGRDYSLGASRPLSKSRTTEKPSPPPSNRNIKPRFMNWDIVVVTGPLDLGHPKFKLYRPLILPSVSLTDVEEATLTVTFADDGFLPESGKWLVAESVASPWDSFEIKQLDTWDDFPSAYQFSASNELEAVRFPLWRFYPADSAIPGGRFKLGAVDNPVYGEKIVGDGPLRLTYGLFNIPSTIHYRTVPYLSF